MKAIPEYLDLDNPRQVDKPFKYINQCEKQNLFTIRHLLNHPQSEYIFLHYRQ